MDFLLGYPAGGVAFIKSFIGEILDAYKPKPGEALTALEQAELDAEDERRKGIDDGIDYERLDALRVKKAMLSAPFDRAHLDTHVLAHIGAIIRKVSFLWFPSLLCSLLLPQTEFSQASFGVKPSRDAELPPKDGGVSVHLADVL